MRYCVGITMATDWGDDDEPRGIDRRLVRRVLAYFRPYWRAGLVALACIAAGALLGLAPALVFRALIDYLGGAHPHFAHVALLVGAGVAAAVTGGLIGVAQSYLEERISQGIIFDLREQVFDRLVHQSVGFYTSNRAGEVMSRIGNDVNGIENVVADTIFGIARNAIVTASTLALMVSFDWRLTLVALVLLPSIAIPMRRAGRTVYKARGRTQAKLAEMSGYLQEVLGISGALLVKAFVKEQAEERRFRTINDELRHLEIRASMIARRFSALMSVFQSVGPALLILAGGWLVVRGDTTVGTVFVFATVLTSRFGMAAGSLGETQVNLAGSLALFRRIFTVLDHPPDVADAADARELATASGAVEIEAVTFAYPGQQQPALEDFNARIEPGQLVALVGPSGAGKTTLTTLIPRFYDPQAGRVLVDGHDVRGLAQQSLREHVGIVFQDTFLFHASIRDNLLYARPDATDDELVAAARAAYMHDFILSLPEGYDTIVGERGHRLSGGEKQRVAIARVILKDPRIMLLDEATSNLDTVSEQLIQAALAPLFADRTSIVIAHRLSTILAADLILVLDRGRLVEQGTHRELLDRGGLYGTLYEHQFRPGREAAPERAATPVALAEGA
jgi:ATP-binding cassette, subfamily B, bacterial